MTKTISKIDESIQKEETLELMLERLSLFHDFLDSIYLIIEEQLAKQNEITVQCIEQCPDEDLLSLDISIFHKDKGCF